MSSICNICEGKLEDGRALPCGKWACNLCIDFLSTTDKKQMKCKNCDKKHEIPPNGFPSESDSVPQIHEAKIRENCNQAREKVKKAIAEAYHKLGTYQAEFLHEIDAHEQKCLDNLSLVSQNKAEIRQIMERPKNLKSAIDNASQLLENIDKAESDLKQILFFVENKKDTFCKNLLGQVKLKSSDVLFLENLDVSREISLKAHLNDAFFTYNYSGSTQNYICRDFFKVNFLPDGLHFTVTYLNQNQNINITLFDKAGNVVKQIKNIVTNNDNSLVDYYILFISRTVIFFAALKYRSYGLATQVQSFDFELNKRKLLNIKLESSTDNSLYGCFEDKLYVFNPDYLNCNLLTIYNSELDMIEQKRFVDPQQPIHYSNMYITSEYIIIFEPIYKNNEDEYMIQFVLLNRKSGTFVKSVKIPLFNYIISYLDKYLAFDAKMDSFHVYDRDFELLDVIQFDKKLLNENDNVRIVFCLEKRQVCFFDENKLSLTFFESSGDADEIITFL